MWWFYIKKKYLNCVRRFLFERSSWAREGKKIFWGWTFSARRARERKKKKNPQNRVQCTVCKEWHTYLRTPFCIYQRRKKKTKKTRPLLSAASLQHEQKRVSAVAFSTNASYTSWRTRRFFLKKIFFRLFSFFRATWIVRTVFRDMKSNKVSMWCLVVLAGSTIFCSEDLVVSKNNDRKTPGKHRRCDSCSFFGSCLRCTFLWLR